MEYFILFSVLMDVYLNDCVMPSTFARKAVMLQQFYEYIRVITSIGPCVNANERKFAASKFIKVDQTFHGESNIRVGVCLVSCTSFWNQLLMAEEKLPNS